MRSERDEPSHPITEDDIANYLVSSPDFFVRHADVLSAVTIASPHGGRAVSLQERQAEMLRAKIKALEQRIVEMMGNAHDNMVLADKLEQLACRLLRVDDAALLPALIASEVASRFEIPQVAIKLWELAEPFENAPFAQGASDDAKLFASSLTGPFCGANPGFEVTEWLDEPQSALSLALVPLRFQTRAELAQAKRDAQQLAADEEEAAITTTTTTAAAADALPVIEGKQRIEPGLTPFADDGGVAVVDVAAPGPDDAAQHDATPPACGMLVLASGDPRRFQTGMGTEFLERLADLAGAALSRLRADAE